MKLREKVAIVLPGTFGVGHDTAVRFAAEGAKVVVGGTDDGNARKTLEAIERAGSEGHYERTSLLSEVDIQRLVASAVDRFGGVDVVFGCPDYYLPGTITQQTAEVFDATLAYNCRSLFFLAKHAIPRLLERAGGTIVFLASVYAHATGSYSAAYEASKGTVWTMTRYFAERFAARRIRVNCIGAGSVVAPLRDLPDELPWFCVKEEKEVERISEFYPTGRLALPDDIAKAAVFLASEDSSCATGSMLSIDGGLTCR